MASYCHDRASGQLDSRSFAHDPRFPPSRRPSGDTVDRGARNGEADVLMVHDKASELKFIAGGHGIDLARHQCAGLRCAPAATWGLATTPDSLIIR